ncbi:MAG: hypothetical protein ABSF65_05365 [Candidatus Bathyarchaeia archaeon]|jgi:predicted DNA-binding protein YlxM (UPF0122 family)
MSIRDIKTFKGIKFPPNETELGNLTAKQLLDKINAFYQRYDIEGPLGDEAESYFLQLMQAYPVSMCAYSTSEALKLTIALIYFDSKPTEEEKSKANDQYEGYSCEDLALIFDRSKATIHAAIEGKEDEAKAIVEEARLRILIKSEARKQLIDEEKAKMKKEIGETPS